MSDELVIRRIIRTEILEALKPVRTEITEILEALKPKKVIKWPKAYFGEDVEIKKGVWKELHVLKPPVYKFEVFHEVFLSDSPHTRCLCFLDEKPWCPVTHGVCPHLLKELGLIDYNRLCWCHVWASDVDEDGTLEYGVNCIIPKGIPPEHTFRFGVVNYDEDAVVKRVWLRWTEEEILQ